MLLRRFQTLQSCPVCCALCASCAFSHLWPLTPWHSKESQNCDFNCFDKFQFFSVCKRWDGDSETTLEGSKVNQGLQPSTASNIQNHPIIAHYTSKSFTGHGQCGISVQVWKTLFVGFCSFTVFRGRTGEAVIRAGETIMSTSAGAGRTSQST